MSQNLWQCHKLSHYNCYNLWQTFLKSETMLLTRRKLSEPLTDRFTVILLTNIACNMSQNLWHVTKCHKFCYRTLRKLSERLYMHFLDPRKSQNVSEDFFSIFSHDFTKNPSWPRATRRDSPFKHYMKFTKFSLTQAIFFASGRVFSRFV